MSIGINKRRAALSISDAPLVSLSRGELWVFPRLLKNWPAWASLLVASYLVVGVIGNGRTLLSDEIWALLYAGKPFKEQLQAIRYDLVHPPLIYLIERGWLHLFGHTDRVAKTLPLVINIPTLVLFTWLASRVTRHWRLASLLFASAYLQVGSVPNLVRMYGLTLLWTVIAILLWEEWRRKPRASRLILWMAVMVLLIYTHYFGLLLLAAWLVVNWCYGPRRLVFTAAAVTTGLTFLPWLLYVLPVYLGRGLKPNVEWVDQEPSRAVAKLPFYFLSDIPAGWNPFASTEWFQSPHWQPALIVIAGIAQVALLMTAWRAVRQWWLSRRDDQTAQWFWKTALLVGISVGLLYGFSVVITPTLHARFLAGVLPAYWLLVVLLGQHGGRMGRALLYGFFLPWVLAGICLGLVQNTRPLPIREGTLLISREWHETDLILCDNFVGPQVYWEWAGRLNRTGRLEVLLPFQAKDWWAAVLPQSEIESIDFAGVERVWFCTVNGRRFHEVSQFLAVQGFVLDQPLQAKTPFLSLFTRVKTVATP